MKKVKGKALKIAEAVILKAVEKDLDNRDVTLNLSFYYGGEWIPASLERLKFTSGGIMALRGKGADIHDGNRHDVWTFLDQQEKSTAPTYHHKGLGWRTVNATRCFCHQEAVGVPSAYAGEYDLGPRGSLGDWKRAIQEHVIGHPLLELMLAVGFSSALIEPLERRSGLKSLLVHCHGDSSKGKTTAANLALSIWGNPDTGGQGLLQTWNATDNALMAKQRSNRGVAVGIDEFGHVPRSGVNVMFPSAD